MASNPRSLAGGWEGCLARRLASARMVVSLSRRAAPHPDHVTRPAKNAGHVPTGLLTCTAPRPPPSGMLREAAVPPVRAASPGPTGRDGRPAAPFGCARDTLRVRKRGRDGLRCGEGRPGRPLGGRSQKEEDHGSGH
jgi:hypothetical protein